MKNKMKEKRGVCQELTKLRPMQPVVMPTPWIAICAECKMPEINQRVIILLDNGREFDAIFTDYDGKPAWKIISGGRIHGTVIIFSHATHWRPAEETEDISETSCKVCGENRFVQKEVNRVIGKTYICNDCISKFTKPQRFIAAGEPKFTQAGIPWIKIEEGCEMPDEFQSAIFWIKDRNTYHKGYYRKDGKACFMTHDCEPQKYFTLDKVSHYAAVNTPDEKLTPPVIEVKNGEAYFNGKYLGTAWRVEEKEGK